MTPESVHNFGVSGQSAITFDSAERSIHDLVVGEPLPNTHTLYRGDTGAQCVPAVPGFSADVQEICDEVRSPHGIRALQRAVKSGDIDSTKAIVRYLENDIFPGIWPCHHVSSTLRAAMRAAIKYNRWEIVECLLDNEIEKRSQNSSAFRHDIVTGDHAAEFARAAEDGRTSVIKALLASGWDVHSRWEHSGAHGSLTTWGEEALLRAARRGHDSTVALLTTVGVFVNAQLFSGSIQSPLTTNISLGSRI